MATITEDYVSFETAKLLREKEFNGLCTAYYDCFTTDNFHCGYEPTNFNSIDIKIRNIVAAPTLQMAMKWLRDVHNFHIWVEPNQNKEGLYNAHVKVGWWSNNWAGVGYNTYEASCEAAIKYCLENLK